MNAYYPKCFIFLQFTKLFWQVEPYNIQVKPPSGILGNYKSQELLVRARLMELSSLLSPRIAVKWYSQEPIVFMSVYLYQWYVVLITSPIAKIVWVKNVKAIVVCEFLMKVLKKYNLKIWKKNVGAI